ncbi:hypothetical protein FRC02_002092 [Tulasnella sp. 418]|nr:hypothetical protein FRC02_002092 [Tulasnella sp. 418]
MEENMDAVLTFADEIAPVVSLVNMTQSTFPNPHVERPSLHQLWGVFASIAINFGSSVITLPHKDPDNYAYGYCVVVAFGTFDFTKSAHLIIEVGDENLIFELPPGIPIFFPSALLIHWNSRIVGPHEYRGSVVFWTSGKLFRWVDLGGRLVKSLTEEEKQQRRKRTADVAQHAMSLYPRRPL